MKPDFKQCVLGITETLISGLDGARDDASGPQLEKISLFIFSQHANMPDYLRLPLKILTLLFDAMPILAHGHVFHRLSEARRRRIVERWKNSRWAFRRDFIRFFETLGLFAWYSHRSMPTTSEPQ